jgi:formate hydrogenlyase transcriptional activator
MLTSTTVAEAAGVSLYNELTGKPSEYEQGDVLNAMLAFNLDIAIVRNRKDFQRFVREKLKKIIGFDFVGIAITNEDGLSYSPFIPQEGDSFPNNEPPRYPVDDALFMDALYADEPIVSDLAGAFHCKNIQGYLSRVTPAAKTLVRVVLKDQHRKIGALFLVSATDNQFSSGRLSNISHIAVFLSAAISNIIAYETIERQVQEISLFKQQLESENLYLQQELHYTHSYHEIVGSSTGMTKVFQLVSQVAQTPSSVLILGETGTGKELIARAIHNTSSRKDKVMVKVNCATLPANLIESELFGHERGSFTGAAERRIGKFELANNSTLFLDEIGEMPPDLQVKLLRALQEKEIERIGGNTTIKINVRIIAATNRNLLKEVQQGRFRSDLYFRLNVFPITIPPLRERAADIPVLAAYFLSKHAKVGTKTPQNFSARVVKQLSAYSWPGNVRELEHLIERSILLATGPVINHIFLPVAEDEHNNLLPDTYVKTIDEIERAYIISILKKSNGKIAGIGGAAELLRIPSTTLNSKIKRLNIRKGCTVE